MEGAVIGLEQYLHRYNLIIYGILEEERQNIQHILRCLAVALRFQYLSPSLIDATQDGSTI